MMIKTSMIVWTHEVGGNIRMIFAPERLGIRSRTITGSAQLGA